MNEVEQLLQLGAIAAPFAKWYVEAALGPDVNTRIVSRFFEPTAADRLGKAVRRDPRVKGSVPGLPVRPLKRWYRAGATRDDLVEQGGAAFDRLATSLVIELRSSRRGRAITRLDGELIVTVVIENFIRTLDAADATAAATTQILARIDEGAAEAERQHQEVMDAMARGFAGASASGDVTEGDLSRLPGSARARAERMGTTPAVRDLVHVVTGGSDPAEGIRQLAVEVPTWLAGSDADTLMLAVELAQAFKERQAAAAFLILAAEKSPKRAHLTARAASELFMADDEDAAAKTLDLARRVGADPAIEAVAAQMAGDGAGILSVLPEADALQNAFFAGLRLAGLMAQQPVNDVIRFAELAADRFPLVAGFRLELVRALLERAGQANASARDADWSRAVNLALEARDQRREWGGDSAQAVHYACLAAARLNDLSLVIRLGFTPPRGEALEVEASDPEVRVSVVQAALMMGDVDTARAVDALGSGRGFHDAYIHAEIVAAEGAETEAIRAAYMAAWDTAANDQARGLCLLAMSSAGVTNLPDLAELHEPGPELAALVEASQHIHAGAPLEAVKLLRATERSTLTSRLLTAALLAAEDPDGAVGELRDDATRFNDAGSLVRAVEILVEHDRLSEAAPIAREALSRFPGAGTSRRTFLHGVIVQDAGDRHSWKEMVDLARAWVSDGSGGPTARWALTLAFYNDARPAEAWAEIGTHPTLVPRNAVDARLWAVLAAREAPGPETCRTLLHLIDEFQDDALEQTAVVAFFTMGDTYRGDPGEAVVARFQQLMAKHAVSPDEDEDAAIVVYSGSAEELLDQIRPQLAARAALITDMSQRVRDGYPYGLLAAAGGTEYVATMVHRAAGCHPAVTADRAMQAQERSAVEATLSADVSVDPSVAVVGWYIQPAWPTLRSAFARLKITAPAHRDAAASVERFRQHSDGHLYYADGDVRAADADPATQARLLEHGEWVLAELDRMSVSERTSLGYLGTDRDLPDRFLSWLSALDQAKELGHALWSDDLGLRSLALAEGVPTFSTVAVLEVLRERGVISEPELQTALRSLRQEYVVDLPLDEEWMEESGAADGWGAGAAAAQFGRTAAWEDDRAARVMWSRLVAQAAATDPQLVVGWLRFAALGIVRARVPAIATRSLVEFAGLAIASVEFDPVVTAAAARTIRAVAEEVELPNPAPLLVGYLFNVLTGTVGPAPAAQILSAAEFDPPERDALRALLFPSGPDGA